MDPSDIIALISSMIAALAVVVSVLTGRSAKSAAARATEAQTIASKLSLDVAEKANQISDLSARLQALEWTSAYFSEMKEWGAEATDAMSALIHLSHIRDEQQRFSEWNAARTKISALIDRGRWHFPNERPEDYGHSKPPAYRGYRQRVLDWLVFAYTECNKPPEYCDPKIGCDDSYTIAAKEVALRCQREFVSEIQHVLDPRMREKRIAEVLLHFEEAASMRIDSDSNRRPS